MEVVGGASQEELEVKHVEQAWRCKNPGCKDVMNAPCSETCRQFGNGCGRLRIDCAVWAFPPAAEVLETPGAQDRLSKAGIGMIATNQEQFLDFLRESTEGLNEEQITALTPSLIQI